jgi:hypothetical protein
MSQRHIAKEMLNILEGHEETFKLKIELYEAFATQIDYANMRLIESSFRRRSVDGSVSERKYSVIVADNAASIDGTLRALAGAAESMSIRLDPIRATSHEEVLNAISTRPIDVVFSEYHLGSSMGGDAIIDKISDPFADILIVPMSAWTPQDLERLLERHRSRQDRLRFLRKPFKSFDLGYVFWEVDNYFLGRPYPFPLAYFMRLVTSAPTEHKRLNALKDVVEAIIKYAATILLADLGRLGAMQVFRSQISWSAPLTLGAWLRLLKDLLSYFADHIDRMFMPGLYELLVDKSTGGDTKEFQLLCEFKQDLRDPYIGHGPTLDDGAYGVLAAKYESPIRSLYDKCLFMARYHLVEVEKIDFSQTDETLNQYQSLHMMGLEIKFNLVSWNAKTRLHRRHVYLRARGGEVLPLHPFLVFETCKQCMADRLFLLDSVGKRGEDMLFTDVYNHRLSDTNAKRAFEFLFPNS